MRHEAWFLFAGVVQALSIKEVQDVPRQHTQLERRN